MKKSLLLEWKKVRNYRAFWVLLILFSIAAAGINYIVYHSQTTVSVQSKGQIRLKLFQAPDLWRTTGWLEGFCLVLIGFLFIVLCTNEYSFKTQRQHIIEGLSRIQFITAKWLTLLAIAIFAWLVYFILSLIMGLSIHSEAGLFAGFYYSGYFFIKILLALGVAFVFSIWFKRSGLTIALYLVYYLLLENLFGFFLNKGVPHLGDFLPLASGSMLVSSPFSKFSPFKSDTLPDVHWFLLTAIIWIVIFIFISVRYIRSADL